jgi:hypothetical protein
VRALHNSAPRRGSLSRTATGRSSATAGRSQSSTRSCRPEWLSPFNFFFLPLLSDLDSYPAGYNRSNFKFITPFESDQRKWGKLVGVNVVDGRKHRIGLFPSGKQDRVVPDNLQTILHQYLRRPESKSLGPDGTPCIAETKGLLRRAAIVAGAIVPVGKETDRRWDEGEDVSLLDFHVLEYRENAPQAKGKMVVAHPEVRKRIDGIGIREIMRRTGLHQHTIEKIIRNRPVRHATLHHLIDTMEQNGSQVNAPATKNDSGV